MSFNKKPLLIVIALVTLLAGSIGWYALKDTTVASTITAATTGTKTSTSSSSAGEDIDWSKLPTTYVTLSDTALTITKAGTYVLTGSTTKTVTVNTDGNVRLTLNNATIKSSDGAAITIASAKNTVILLQDGTKNVVEDAATRSDQTIDGAIYSADDLFLEGQGSLSVTAHFADAIVSNDDLTVSGGNYTITSDDDGIRGHDSITITDGNLTIEAAQDAIKSTNIEDGTKGTVTITGGTINITAGDDAIHAEQKAVISGGTINIKSSREGIEGAAVDISGGDIKLYASDDGINAPGSTANPAVITFSGGTVNVTVGSGDTDAVDANGDIYIKGGAITVTAPTSSFDYDGTGEMTGGTLTVNGEQLSDIPEPMMMGGPGGGLGPR